MVRLIRFTYIALTFSLLLTAVPPVQANIIINALYDSSINADPNSAAIQATIQAALNAYQTTITNNITVAIYFQEGGGLGQSNFFVYAPTYTQFYTGLVANDSNAAAIAGLNANGGNALTNGGVNPVTGSTYVEMKSANARAVGINVAPGCVVNATGQGTSGGSVPNDCAGSGSGAKVDGIVSLNTAITTPGGGGFSLLATVEHEVDEILGLGSALENSSGSGTLNASNDTPFAPGTLVSSPEDLYRWNAPTGGSRTLSVNCSSPGSAYFAYGASTGPLTQFNNSCNGADFGDWAGSGTPQVQDAFAAYGGSATLGANEFTALSAIGYNVSAPEPATWTFLLGSLLAGGLWKRKR